MTDYKFYDGTPPHVRHSDTSTQAAIKQRPKAANKRVQVVDFITLQADGATCDECEEALGMLHTTCSARIREASLDGQIADSGRRRNTRNGSAARVYTVTPKQNNLF